MITQFKIKVKKILKYKVKDFNAVTLHITEMNNIA